MKQLDKILKTLTKQTKDHYHALAYYLTKSKSAPYFSPTEGHPSRHPWLENMRFLLRTLGFDRLIRFLDWCVSNHKHPWKGWLNVWQTQKVPIKAEQAPKCACCHETKPLIHTMCRDCSSLTEEQRKELVEQARLRKAGASLTAFGRWNKMTKKTLDGFKALVKNVLEPLGKLQGQYMKYDVYDKRELNLLFEAE